MSPKKTNNKTIHLPIHFFLFLQFGVTGMLEPQVSFTPITNLKSPVAQACVSLLWLKKPKSPKDFIKLPVPRPAIFHYF